MSYPAPASAKPEAKRYVTGLQVATGVITEDQPHKFTAFASDLGWRPGVFPGRLGTTLGNGCDLIRTSLCDDWAIYRQEHGCVTLRVIND